jgi:ABC-type sugar transport system, periplasmic component
MFGEYEEGSVGIGLTGKKEDKMKNKWMKKTIAGVLCMTIAGAGVMGCSSAATNKEDSNSEKKVKISFASTWDPTAGGSQQEQYDNWFMEVKKEYEKKYPDREVEYSAYVWETIDAKLMSDEQAGIERGISLVNSSQLATHYKAGSLTSLQPLWDELTEEEKKDFELVDLEPYKKNGELYALPMTVHTRTFAYRKDLFKAAGLDPEKPPKTLDELVEYAKKLTTDEVYGLGIYLGNEEGTCEVSYNPLIWSFGGDTLDTKTKEATFASEAGIKAAQFLSDCVNKWKITPEFSLSGRREDVVEKPFINGQYAIATGWGPYWFKDMQDAGLVENVTPPSENEDLKNIGFFNIDGIDWYTNTWSLGVSENCTYKEEAFDFIRMAAQWNHLRNYTEGLPVLESAYNEPEYRESEVYQAYKESIQNGKGAVPTVNYKNLTLAVSAAVQEVIMTNDESKTADIMKKYQDEYNAQFAGE